MQFLLDTNTCIEYLRNRNAGVVATFKAKRPADLALSAVVVAELCFGAHKSQAKEKNLQLIGSLAQFIQILPFDLHAAECYGRIRADLERSGTPIGPNDLMIASTALANRLALVTHNTKDFSRVAGLQLEDWHSA